MIDGEVVAIDKNGRVSFNAIQHSRTRAHLQFYAFDLMIHRGWNVTHMPIEKRRELLANALTKVEYPVLQSTPFDAKPADLIRAAKELQLEGIIAKRKGSFYESDGAAAHGKNTSSISLRNLSLAAIHPVIHLMLRLWASMMASRSTSSPR